MHLLGLFLPGLLLSVNNKNKLLRETSMQTDLVAQTKPAAPAFQAAAPAFLPTPPPARPAPARPAPARPAPARPAPVRQQQEQAPQRNFNANRSRGSSRGASTIRNASPTRNRDQSPIRI